MDVTLTGRTLEWKTEGTTEKGFIKMGNDNLGTLNTDKSATTNPIFKISTIGGKVQLECMITGKEGMIGGYADVAAAKTAATELAKRENLLPA